MDERLHFLLVFAVTNIGMGSVVAALLLRWDARLRLPHGAVVLLGLALGPFLASLLLYYHLLLLPGRSAPAVLVTALTVAVGLGLMAGRGWALLGRRLRAVPALLRDDVWMRWFAAGGLLMLGIAAMMLATKPLVDHDVLEYAVRGRWFLDTLEVTYERHPFDARNGFYYVGLHGHSFPLLFTWDGLWQRITGATGDLWPRSITLWYTWLLIALMWSVLRQWDRALAFVGVLNMVVPFGFALLLVIHHLDSYRITLFTAMVLLVLVLRERPELPLVLLFGAVLGAQAFIHSTGAILGGVLWVLWLLMHPGTLRDRMVHAGASAALALAFGGVHYVLDTLIGTRWIFKDIIWF